MTRKSQPGKIQSVLVVEADILDRMNETDASIAQRAYEIYQSRGSVHGADQQDQPSQASKRRLREKKTFPFRRVPTSARPPARLGAQ